MSRRAIETHPLPWMYPGGPPPIVPHDHDVLSGRGVNIAQHPGNERFRTLINSRYDPHYCTHYSTHEKRAVAQQVIGHIQGLSPPGRFLKRQGRSKTSRGLEGPWEELSEADVLKKTCQALRDCCRQDRTGYAAQVVVPEDVKQKNMVRSSSGLSNKQQAQQAAMKGSQTLQGQRTPSASPPPTAPIELTGNQETTSGAKRAREQLHQQEQQYQQQQPPVLYVNPGPYAPPEPNDLWFKKPRLSDGSHTYATPTTAASSGGMLHDTSFLDSVPSSTASHPTDDLAPNVFMAPQYSIPPSPSATHYDHSLGAAAAAFVDTFASDLKADDSQDLDPLHLAEAAIEHAEHDQHHAASGYLMLGGTVADFPPPSPPRPTFQPGYYSNHHHHHQPYINNNNGEPGHGHFEH